MAYLIHFNPNHDKLGRFTFSKGNPDQKANYKYLKESPTYSSTYDRANELSKKFSPEYRERFQKKVDSVDNFIDLSKMTSKELDDYVGFNAEVDKLLGKYGDKVFDKRMNQTYADLLRRSEFNRLFGSIQSRLIDDPETTEKRIKKFNDEHNLLSLDGKYGKYTSDPKFRKRADDAAVLGLKTLIRLDGKNTDIDNPNDKGWKEWFLFEDQTIGMPTLADLVNQGYSKEKILETMSTIDDIRLRTGEYEGINLHGKIPGSFELEESNNHMYSNTEFIDEAIKIKNGE